MLYLYFSTKFFSFFQLWRLAILEPVGVQRHNVPHFEGLIVLYLDSRSSRAWHHFYVPHTQKKKAILHLTPATVPSGLLLAVSSKTNKNQTMLLKTKFSCVPYKI